MKTRRTILLASFCGVLFSACLQDPPPAICSEYECDPDPAWQGSVAYECSPADESWLVLSFDPDSARTAASRKYRLYDPVPSLDALQSGLVVTDTLEICENGVCANEIVEIQITYSDSARVQGGFEIRELTGSSAEFKTAGDLVLALHAGDSTASCLP